MADPVGAHLPDAPDDDPPTVWRVGRAGLLAGRVGVGAAVAAAVGSAAAWVLASPGADREAAAVVAVLGLVVGVLAWRAALHPRIVAGQDVLLVRNPLGDRAIPWTDVVEVVAGYGGVTVTSTGAPPATAWAVQKSNLSAWRGTRTRADVVVERLQALATARRSTLRDEVARPSAHPGYEPADAVREPLPFPWRMTRPEALVVGFLRHTDSPPAMAAAAALFLVLGLACGSTAVHELWDGHVLAQRGVVVEATVVAVPGLVEVTWPAVEPRTVRLETDEDDVPVVGQQVEVLADPVEPTRARLAGFAPDLRPTAAITAGVLLLGVCYLKWWRWLAVRGRRAP